MRAKLITLMLAAASAGVFAIDPAGHAREKIRQIQEGKAPRGSVVSFTGGELTAYARSELPSVVPAGLREPRLELGEGTATGYALIDFLKLQHAQGSNIPWLLARLIEGERPVKVITRIVSAQGQATVYLQRVEISGIGVSGGALDFLIRDFFLPLYPDAKINQPFALGANIDRIEVTSATAKVYIRR